MKRTRRSSQVGEKLRDELSRIIRRELNDPDLMLTSITDVEMAPDLHFAKVWISALGDDAQKKNALEAIRRSDGRIRRFLAESRAFRFIPEIDWKIDQSVDYASRIEEALKNVIPPNPENEPDESE